MEQSVVLRNAQVIDNNVIDIEVINENQSYDYSQFKCKVLSDKML